MVTNRDIGNEPENRIPLIGQLTLYNPSNLDCEALQSSSIVPFQRGPRSGEPFQRLCRSIFVPKRTVPRKGLVDWQASEDLDLGVLKLFF